MLLNLFAQISEENAKTSTSIIDLIKQGGITMIPLFILSLIAVYIFIERFLAFKQASKAPENFMETVNDMVAKQDIDGALSHCQQENSALGRMMAKGLSRLGNPLKMIEESIENVGKVETDRLEKNMTTLATIAGAAPMLGFLGTVLGMIKTFQVISSEGNVGVSDMAGGISEAMVTTATGLIVGIMAYIAYNYLSAKLQTIIHRLEHSSIEFLDLLQEPQK